MAAPEERYRLMFRSNPQPMFVLEPGSLRFLEVNAAAARMYGYHPEELVRMTLEDFWLPEEIAKNQRTIAQAVRGARYTGIRHRKKDGSVCHIEAQVEPIPVDGKEALLVVVTDVTEQSHSNEARRAAEARFARLFDSGVIGIVVATLSGRIV